MFCVVVGKLPHRLLRQRAVRTNDGVQLDCRECSTTESIMAFSRFLAFTTAWYLIFAASVEAQQWPMSPEVGFTIAKEEPRGVWILNGSTGSVRFCKSAAPVSLPVCSNWSVPAETAPAPGLASVNCGKRTYDLSTGTSTGSCSTSTGRLPPGPGGQNTQASCIDAKGNTASVNCDNVSGLGSCATAGGGICKEVNAASN